jgi:hypothetical protein
MFYVFCVFLDERGTLTNTDKIILEVQKTSYQAK